MPTRVTVEEAHNIRVATIFLSGEYTIEEWFAALDELLDVVIPDDGRTGTIVDYTEVTRLPPGMVTNFPRTADILSQYYAHELPPAVVVGAPISMQAILEIFPKVFNIDVYFEPTWEEGAAHLAARLQVTPLNC